MCQRRWTRESFVLLLRVVLGDVFMLSLGGVMGTGEEPLRLGLPSGVGGEDMGVINSRDISCRTSVSTLTTRTEKTDVASSSPASVWFVR